VYSVLRSSLVHHLPFILAIKTYHRPVPVLLDGFLIGFDGQTGLECSTNCGNDTRWKHEGNL
jgi:hypothetical protein